MLLLLATGILSEGGDPPVEPNGEPVSLELAKQFAKIDTDDDDALVELWITAARQAVEDYTGLILVRREIVEEHVPTRDGYLELFKGPDVDVASIAYLDTDEAEQAYTGALVRANRKPVRVYPALDAPWPSLNDGAGFLVTYTAGYADGEVPEKLRQAMLFLISHFDKNREAVTDLSANELPWAVKALCDPYRMAMA